MHLSTSNDKLDFARVLLRLSDLSQRKAHDPFRDVPWDGPESEIDPRDPRFRLRPDEPLGATAWYAALPGDEQSRLGLDPIDRWFAERIELVAPRFPELFFVWVWRECICANTGRV